MALDIVQYNSGDPITAGTTYQFPSSLNFDAWIFNSTTPGAHLRVTQTEPEDDDWSNILEGMTIIDGMVKGLVLSVAARAYFKVVKEPITQYASMSLVEQNFDSVVKDPINPFVAGTSVAPGYYDLSSLNLEEGKMYVLSVLPEQDKDYPETPGIVTDETFSAVIVGLTGAKATQVILRGITTVGSHLFVMTGAKPVLHLGGRSNVKFNVTVTSVVFSAGGGGFDPSQPATITGMWTFTNIIVPTPTAAGNATNKQYVDNAVASVPRFDTSEDYVLTGSWNFERVPMTSATPNVPNDMVTKGYVDTAVAAVPVFNPASNQNITGNWDFAGKITHTGSPVTSDDLTNKLYVDGQIAPTVKNVGDQSIAGVKTFTDGVTLADETSLTFGVGADAVKFHGTGAGMSVIEGGTGAHLDVAVSTTFQEPTVFQDVTSFSARITAEKGISFGITSGSSTMDVLMEMYHPTLEVYGCKWTYIANNGYYQLVQRNNIVWLTFDPTGNVWFRKNFNADGPALFSQGVTMSQTLTVAGQVTFNGTFIAKNNIELQDESGVLMQVISGEYGSPDESTICFFDSTRTKYIRINYNNATKRVQFTLPVTGSLMELPGSTVVNGTLTASGRITASEGINLPEGLDIMFGSSASIYSDSSSNIMIEGSAAGRTLLNQALRFPTDSVLDSTSGVNIETGDARYLKFISTTKAAYDALATKDSGTVYFLTDMTPPSWAIGNKEIVTADFPTP